jgi:hypothetical protein
MKRPQKISLLSDVRDFADIARMRQPASKTTQTDSSMSGHFVHDVRMPFSGPTMNQ